MMVRVKHPPNEVDQVARVAADRPPGKAPPPAHLLGHSVHQIISCDMDKVLPLIAVERHDAAE